MGIQNVETPVYGGGDIAKACAGKNCAGGVEGGQAFLNSMVQMGSPTLTVRNPSGFSR